MPCPLARPDAIGIDSGRLKRVEELLQRWIATDGVPAAGWCVGRRGRIIEPRFVGRQRPAKDAPPLRRDALFLVASIAKRVTVAAVMMLVERGQLTLEDRVATFVPRFAANGKDQVQIRHLMTHTSGLPDMLPNNDALRRAHRPFAAFVQEICRLKLLFSPGTRVNYQSMGAAILAQGLHPISGLTPAEFLAQEVFGPRRVQGT